MPKKDTHPELFDVCFVDVGTGTQFLTKSTMRSKETITVDGVEYFRIARDVTSASHPAYTGDEGRVVDTENRIGRFNERFGRRRR